MRAGSSLVLAGLAACGGGGGAPDAAIDAGPRCDPAAPFGPPAVVGGLNSDQDDAAARLSPDELEVTFARLTGGVWDLWRATRASVDEPFGAPALLTTVNSIRSDVWPTVSPDGLVLLFDADRTTPNTFHIWRSTRASTSVPFGPPQPRPELMDDDVQPMLANEAALYFVSTVRGGLGAGEILRAPIDAAGAIGTPVAIVGDVNTADHEDSPAITADERFIYFRRQPASGMAMESDVFTASRSTPSDGFGASAPVPGLDRAGVGEIPNWVSPDNCHLYVHSDADTGGGPMGTNIWMAARAAAAP
ncbi:MAG: PD40 domain-containing protein [Myxococcales bacterium]|nr:PD40 domain-containing protein [Myxococcales bacterium]